MHPNGLGAKCYTNHSIINIGFCILQTFPCDKLPCEQFSYILLSVGVHFVSKLAERQL
jgi:hypothetical protein